MNILGIDVGGSGLKGAVVDTLAGSLVTERHRVKTPEPSTPESMGDVFAHIVKHFEWRGRIGCGMPGPIKGGKMMTANNLDKSWLGVAAHDIFSRASGQQVAVVNDADAAGLAEIRFGAGKGVAGVVLVITLGTGIGSALFVDGTLVPNTELGQIEVRGKVAERRASANARKREDLSWKQWSKRLSEYLSAVEQLVWPDLIILGGGVSEDADKFIPRIKTRTRVVSAQLGNEAGIIGAALCAR